MRVMGWLIAVLFCISTNAAMASEPIVIRFSHVVSENTPKGIGAKLFKERAEARLPGRVRVDLYPGAQKFNDSEVVLALLFGDVEMAAPSFAKLTTFNKALRIFDLPFVFPNMGAYHRFVDSPAGQNLLEGKLPAGIRGLAYWDNGVRVMTAKRALRTPGDADGLVFRIEPSVVLQAQYSRIGAIPQPMPFGRLRDAVRDGVIDAQENTWSNIASKQIQRMHPFVTDLNHSVLGYMVIVSDEFWSGLPDDIRATLDQIIAELSVELRIIADDHAIRMRDEIAATDGVTIVTPSSAELAQWRDALCPVWDQFEADIGAATLAEAVNAANADATAETTRLTCR
jgi:C4-dicarboxylate-binding protein DctP